LLGKEFPQPRQQRGRLAPRDIAGGQGVHRRAEFVDVAHVLHGQLGDEEAGMLPCH
jgi:hypothetical protein